MRIVLRHARLVLLLLGLMSGADRKLFSQDRLPAVAGSFYPSGRQQLEESLESLFAPARKITGNQPLALVVPHAGYLFSGEVAASAYRQLDRNRSYRHIFILGPTHRMYFDGVSVYTGSNFITPLGKVPVDPLAARLVEQNSFLSSDPAPHRHEHCIEVQLPFLQYWLEEPFSVVALLVGGESRETTRKLAEILQPWFNDENLFIISADFSHYPPAAMGREADLATADAIAANSPQKFIEAIAKNKKTYGTSLATSICGWMPMLTLLQITGRREEITWEKIMYRNSGDSPHGDKQKVVGYWALAATKQADTAKAEGFRLTEGEKETLLKMARSTLREYLTTRTLPVTGEKELSPNLRAPAGAFVTLREKGRLRGCIGNFFSREPLYRTVQEMAVAAATRDTRFDPVNPAELTRIDIEISVLTPLKKIGSPSEFRLGKDGIYMVNGERSGTFLPQVAEETGWTTEEFLGHCARDKARIGWDGWKDPNTELYTYQAFVFGEKTSTPAY